MRATWGRVGLLAMAVAGAVAGAGCSSTGIHLVLGTGSATPGSAVTSSAVSSSAASGSASAPLVQVHDPGRVTGTAPTSCHALPGPRPDPACTPGAIDPSVTQANIKTTICTSGYTASVRPPTGQTDTLKRSMYTAYGIPAGTTSELDHLVSLELGGANDVTNLWPEVGTLPNPKDAVENDLHKAVCSGKVTLAAAQQAIASDWQTAETVLGIGKG